MEADTRTVLGRALRTTAVLAGLVVIWEVASRAELLNAFLFPAPTTIVRDTIEAFSDPPYISGAPLWFHIVKSVYRSLAGWIIGVILGVVFGLVVEWRRQLGAVATALLEFTRPIPVILALPILVLIIGLGDTPRIIIIAWAVFVFQAINTIYGVRSARGALLPDVVRSFGGGEVDVLTKSVMGLARPPDRGRDASGGRDRLGSDGGIGAHPQHQRFGLVHRLYPPRPCSHLSCTGPSSWWGFLG